MNDNADKLAKVIVSQRIIRNAFKKYVLQNEKAQHLVRLNSNELMTLFYLRVFPGLTQKEMSDYLDYDLATAGRILNSMAKKGVITRVKSKTDARKNDIALTDKGIEILETLYKLMVEWYLKNTKGLSTDNNAQEKANDQLIRLAEFLTKDWGATDEWEK